MELSFFDARLITNKSLINALINITKNETQLICKEYNLNPSHNYSFASNIVFNFVIDGECFNKMIISHILLFDKTIFQYIGKAIIPIYFLEEKTIDEICSFCAASDEIYEDIIIGDCTYYSFMKKPYIDASLRTKRIFANAFPDVMKDFTYKDKVGHFVLKDNYCDVFLFTMYYYGDTECISIYKYKTDFELSLLGSFKTKERNISTKIIDKKNKLFQKIIEIIKGKKKI